MDDIVSFQNVPPDLAICCFILEQSLSVRALQEMLSNTSDLNEVGFDRGSPQTVASFFLSLMFHS